MKAEFLIEKEGISTATGFIKLDHPVKEHIGIGRKLFLLLWPEKSNTVLPANVLCIDLDSCEIIWTINPDMYVTHSGPPNELDIITGIIHDTESNTILCFPWDGPCIAISIENFSIIEKKGARWGIS